MTVNQPNAVATNLAQKVNFQDSYSLYDVPGIIVAVEENSMPQVVTSGMNQY